MTFSVGDRAVPWTIGAMGESYGKVTQVVSVGKRYIRTAEGDQYKLTGELKGACGFVKPVLRNLNDPDTRTRYEEWVKARRATALRSRLQECAKRLSVIDLERIVTHAEQMISQQEFLKPGGTK